MATTKTSTHLKSIGFVIMFETEPTTKLYALHKKCAYEQPTKENPTCLIKKMADGSEIHIDRVSPEKVAATYYGVLDDEKHVTFAVDNIYNDLKEADLIVQEKAEEKKESKVIKRTIPAPSPE